MAENNLPVITISRQYGAGGRSIATALSEKLSIPWYDSNLMKIIAEKSGYSEEEVQKDSEEMSTNNKFMEMILNNATSYVSPYDAVYKAQKEAIIELAKSPCIIVGRCSNIILRKEGINTFDVFLFADLETRMKRAEALNENGKEDLKKYIEQRDHLRETYYKKYSGLDLGRYKDYDLCIDTGKLGYENSINIIYEAVTNLK